MSDISPGNLMPTHQMAQSLQQMVVYRKVKKPETPDAYYTVDMGAYDDEEGDVPLMPFLRDQLHGEIESLALRERERKANPKSPFANSRWAEIPVDGTQDLIALIERLSLPSPGAIEEEQWKSAYAALGAIIQKYETEASMFAAAPEKGIISFGGELDTSEAWREGQTPEQVKGDVDDQIKAGLTHTLNKSQEKVESLSRAKVVLEKLAARFNITLDGEAPQAGKTR